MKRVNNPHNMNCTGKGKITFSRNFFLYWKWTIWALKIVMIILFWQFKYIICNKNYIALGNPVVCFFRKIDVLWTVPFFKKLRRFDPERLYYFSTKIYFSNKISSNCFIKIWKRHKRYENLYCIWSQLKKFTVHKCPSGPLSSFQNNSQCYKSPYNAIFQGLECGRNDTTYRKEN